MNGGLVSWRKLSTVSRQHAMHSPNSITPTFPKLPRTGKFRGSRRSGIWAYWLIDGRFERHAGLLETEYTSAQLHYPARRQLINWPTNGQPVHPDHNAGHPQWSPEDGGLAVETEWTRRNLWNVGDRLETVHGGSWIQRLYHGRGVGTVSVCPAWILSCQYHPISITDDIRYKHQ